MQIDCSFLDPIRGKLFIPIKIDTFFLDYFSCNEITLQNFSWYQ